MSAEPIIGLVIAAFFISNRARWLYLYRKNRKAADRFERQLTDLHRVWSGPSPYRAADDRDADLVRLLDGPAKPFEEQLRARGFLVLGDIVADRSQATAVSRVLVDGAGTTCAYVMIAPAQPTRAVFAIASYAADEMYSTRTLRVPHAEPPSTHRQMGAPALSVAELVDLHAKYIDRPDTSFARITDMTTLLAQLAAVHERTAAWRNAQPPDQLLDTDLRAALGEHYERWGKAWARRIRTNSIPRARSV